MYDVKCKITTSSFSSKIYVITGSTDGIGKAYAKQLAKRGMNIVLVSRTKEKLEKVASQIRDEFNVKTKIIVADFREGSPIYKHIENELNDIPVGILVNNVAMFMEHPKYFDQLSFEYLWDVINVNIASSWLMTNMVLRSMKKRKKGAIINLSSLLEFIPCPLSSNYSATKAFLKNFTLALQDECRSDGITVQLLSPAFLKTNLTRFSDYVYNFNELYVPNAETFASHAINTLTRSEHTTGYWPHEFLYWTAQILPEPMRTYLAGIIARFMLLKHKKLLINGRIRVEGYTTNARREK
ncbi:hypothetical protein PGB90_009690 [Kerria lacca]